MVKKMKLSLMFLLLFIGINVLYLWQVLVPAYTNPDSYMYASDKGYPAMLRLLGKPIPVTAVKPKWSDVEDLIIAQGYLSGASNDIRVSSSMQGKVEDVMFDVGVRVNKGDLLIKLETKSHEINVQKAKYSLDEKRVALRQAEQNLKREQNLFDDGVIALEQLELKKIAYSDAYSNYLVCQEDLKKAELSGFDAPRIMAPISGLITFRGINPGEVLRDVGKPLIKIVGELSFKAFFDEEYTAKVALGMEGNVRLNAYPSRSFRVKATKINPAVRTSDDHFLKSSKEPRVFNVWLSFEDDISDIAPGLKGFVELSHSTRKLLLPAGALIHLSGGEGLILVIENENLKLRRVRYGITRGSMVEITEGIDPEDTELLIVSAPAGLTEGDRVRLDHLD